MRDYKTTCSISNTSAKKVVRKMKIMKPVVVSSPNRMNLTLIFQWIQGSFKKSEIKPITLVAISLHRRDQRRERERDPMTLLQIKNKKERLKVTPPPITINPKKPVMIPNLRANVVGNPRSNQKEMKMNKMLKAMLRAIATKVLQIRENRCKKKDNRNLNWIVLVTIFVLEVVLLV